MRTGWGMNEDWRGLTGRGGHGQIGPGRGGPGRERPGRGGPGQ